MQQLDRQCEKYLGGPTVAYAERTHATISHDGKIFLNQKVHAMMGRPAAVYLYYNRQTDTIILEPTPSVTSNTSFTFRDGGHGARVIYANPFCKHFGITTTGTQRFIAPETDAIGRLYLKLSETVTVTRGPRLRKRKSMSESG